MMPPAMISQLPRLALATEQSIEIKEHSIDALLSILFLLAGVPALYVLHRLGLYLESRGLIYYWHKKPSGGAAYNALQELVQPQVRHVIEVGEQRLGEAADGDGAPPNESTDCIDRGGYTGSAHP
jgi:hypothetical protein